MPRLPRSRTRGDALRASLLGALVLAAGCELLVHSREEVDTPVDGGGGSGTGAGGGSADAGPEAGSDATSDAAVCVPVALDPTSPKGDPACPFDGGACVPSDVTSFTPTWTPPLAGAPHLGACSSSLIDQYFTDCFDPSTATAAACSSFDQKNPSCVACLLTTDAAAARYGAFIGLGPITTQNLAGCIAAAEPCNLGCAESLQASYKCQWAACTTSQACKQASVADVTTCEGAARACGCSEYQARAADCFNQLLVDPAHHPAVAACALNLTDFKVTTTTIAGYLCGP